MKVLVLYRPDAEFSTDVESFAREFQNRYEAGNKLELVSLNTRDGAATASLYDIMSYPAILALNGDGSVLNIWQGMPMPLMDEIAGYVYNASN